MGQGTANISSEKAAATAVPMRADFEPQARQYVRLEFSTGERAATVGLGASMTSVVSGIVLRGPLQNCINQATGYGCSPYKGVIPLPVAEAMIGAGILFSFLSILFGMGSPARAARESSA